MFFRAFNPSSLFPLPSSFFLLSSSFQYENDYFKLRATFRANSTMRLA